MTQAYSRCQKSGTDDRIFHNNEYQIYFKLPIVNQLSDQDISKTILRAN